MYVDNVIVFWWRDGLLMDITIDNRVLEKSLETPVHGSW